MEILYKAMSSRGPAETAKAVLAVHRGAILMAPSRRITSPLSIGLPTILSTSCAYSDGLPRRAGCGTCAPKAACTFSGKASSRSEEHTSELQSLMRISYAGFCLKKKNKKTDRTINETK